MKLSANVYQFPQGALRQGDKFMPRTLRKPKPEPIPTLGKRKTRRQRFDTIVPKRMADLQKQLILLGNCASSNYQYTQEDAAKIEATLRKWVELTIAKFKASPPDLPEFKL